MDNKNYPSDLTNEQWKLIEPLLPPAKTGGRPRITDLPQVINGILYLVRTGCSWRMLPHDFPPWPTVHDLSPNSGTMRYALGNVGQQYTNIFCRRQLGRIQTSFLAAPQL